MSIKNPWTVDEVKATKKSSPNKIIGVDRGVDIGDEEIEEVVNNNDLCQWIETANKTYIPSAKIKLRNTVPAGIYDIAVENYRFVLKKQSVNLDELLFLPMPVFDTVLSDMKFFWEHEENFKKYKYAYKRGILLYGKAGCGKSSLTALISEVCINMGGVVFNVRNGSDLDRYDEFISTYFRAIEKNTKILTIIEDIDGLVRSEDNETKLLNILDGMSQINNAVYIGCTNYPENLKERILNRPNRFDKRYEIGLPDPEVRKFYFEHKILKEDLEKTDIKYLVNKTENLTISHLGELIKSVYIFGKDLDMSIEELKNMGKFISSSKYEDKNKPKTGFNFSPIANNE